MKYIKRINTQQRKSLIQELAQEAYVPKLRELLTDVDLVHCMQGGALGMAAERVSREKGLPFMITPYVHPGQYGDSDSEIALYKRADLVFALLETDRDVLLELGVAQDRTRLAGVVPILPESTDPKGFRARHGLGDNPTVLFIGRMEAYKGFLALRDAVSQVWSEMPDVHFVFVGPAGNKELKVRQALSMHDDRRVQYLGRVSDQEKGDALAACDLFCMPSLYEILPAVYLEAWSFGKAVIGGTAHGLRELIEGNGAGIVVDQDPREIANRIVDVLKDQPRLNLMGERGRSLVQERFSASALEQLYLTAYEQVCDGQGSSRNRNKKAIM